MSEIKEDIDLDNIAGSIRGMLEKLGRVATISMLQRATWGPIISIADITDSETTKRAMDGTVESLFIVAASISYLKGYDLAFRLNKIEDSEERKKFMLPHQENMDKILDPPDEFLSELKAVIDKYLIVNMKPVNEYVPKPESVSNDPETVTANESVANNPDTVANMVTSSNESVAVKAGMTEGDAEHVDA